MKPIERLTEKLAAQICKDRGLSAGMRELCLLDAYNLVYFGDKIKLQLLIKKAKAEKEYKATLATHYEEQAGGKDGV